MAEASNSIAPSPPGPFQSSPVIPDPPRIFSPNDVPLASLSPPLSLCISHHLCLSLSLSPLRLSVRCCLKSLLARDRFERINRHADVHLVDICICATISNVHVVPDIFLTFTQRSDNIEPSTAPISTRSNSPPPHPISLILSPSLSLCLSGVVDPHHRKRYTSRRFQRLIWTSSVPSVGICHQSGHVVPVPIISVFWTSTPHLSCQSLCTPPSIPTCSNPPPPWAVTLCGVGAVPRLERDTHAWSKV